MFLTTPLHEQRTVNLVNLQSSHMRLTAPGLNRVLQLVATATNTVYVCDSILIK